MLIKCCFFFKDMSGNVGMAQVVKHFLSKCEALSSNSSTAKKKKEEKRRKESRGKYNAEGGWECGEKTSVHKTVSLGWIP
jgi:hypothetical protein